MPTSGGLPTPRRITTWNLRSWSRAGMPFPPPRFEVSDFLRGSGVGSGVAPARGRGCGPARLDRARPWSLQNHARPMACACCHVNLPLGRPAVLRAGSPYGRRPRGLRERNRRGGSCGDARHPGARPPTMGGPGPGVRGVAPGTAGAAEAPGCPSRTWRPWAPGGARRCDPWGAGYGCSASHSRPGSRRAGGSAVRRGAAMQPEERPWARGLC